MSAATDFFVRFWGVRGSIACPGTSTLRYGGNTSCLEIRCGDRTLIFDGGTGMRELGLHLDRSGPTDADVFFTHTHFDHIVGIPFFSTAHKKGNRLRFWAGHLQPDFTLKQVLSGMMEEPLFPVPLTIFGADCSFKDFTCGEVLTPAPGVTLRTAPLNHPNRATGYRVEYNGNSICYVTDTEHKPGEPDRNILGLIANADIVIYDSTYTDDEYPTYIGWGHSTWQEGVRLCRQAGAKKLVIFHHDPSHDDAFMDKVAAAADAALPGTVVAREGLVISP